jgi:hypothetical protein
MAATPTSWKREPFGIGIPIPYQAVFSDEQFNQLQMGIIPKVMEDKWFIYYEQPYLFLHRSWTGQSVYRLALKEVKGGAEVTEALWSKELANRFKDSPHMEYQAHLLDFLISNLLLGQSKPFPMPPGVDEPSPGLIQHHVSGTGYPQSKLKKS